MKTLTGISTDRLIPWAMPPHAVSDTRPGGHGAGGLRRAGLGEGFARLPGTAIRALVLLPVVLCLSIAWVLAALLSGTWMALAYLSKRSPVEWDE